MGRGRGTQAGREQPSHAGSDGNVGASAQGGPGTEGGRSGRAVKDMLGVGAAATQHGGLVTLSCSLSDPNSSSECWVPMAPLQMKTLQDTPKSSPFGAPQGRS